MDNFDFFEIHSNSRVPKYKQVMDSILTNISIGRLKLGQKIPSINGLSEEFLLSRDTVEKAYRILKKQKVIVSVKGKGFYIANTDLTVKINILFLINKLSAYKMHVFNAFMSELGANVKVDLDIYHCKPDLFNNIINKKKDLYEYFVIMPHFISDSMQHMGCTDEILKSLMSIPEDKLIVLDRNLKGVGDNVGRVYQDFTEDIYSALNKNYGKLEKYKKIILVYPNKAVYPYPKGIVTGFKRFCIYHDKDFEILDEIYDNMDVQLQDLYIIIEEHDLVNLVKQARFKKIKLGQDFGIISYNETQLKELLGITVISTNFEKMGQEAAKMILNKKNDNIKNEFDFIDRYSI